MANIAADQNQNKVSALLKVTVKKRTYIAGASEGVLKVNESIESFKRFITDSVELREIKTKKGGEKHIGQLTGLKNEGGTLLFSVVAVQTQKVGGIEKTVFAKVAQGSVQFQQSLSKSWSFELSESIDFRFSAALSVVFETEGEPTTIEPYPFSVSLNKRNFSTACEATLLRGIKALNDAKEFSKGKRPKRTNATEVPETTEETIV